MRTVALSHCHNNSSRSEWSELQFSRSQLLVISVWEEMRLSSKTMWQWSWELWGWSYSSVDQIHTLLRIDGSKYLQHVLPSHSYIIQQNSFIQGKQTQRHRKYGVKIWFLQLFLQQNNVFLKWRQAQLPTETFLVKTALWRYHGTLMVSNDNTTMVLNDLWSFSWHLHGSPMYFRKHASQKKISFFIF